MTELSQFLLDRGFVSRSDIDKAIDSQANTGERLTTVLQHMAMLQGVELARALSEFYQVPVVEDDEWPSGPICCGDEMPTTFLKNNRVFPIAKSDNHITLAMVDPSNSFAISAVRLATYCQVSPKIALAEDIEAAIANLARDEGPDPWVTSPQNADTADDVQHLRELALGTPVVRLVDQLLQDAIYARATDIHIEPFEKTLKIRIRVDGMLREVSAPPLNMARAIVSRIKILAGLNIAERRLPQDGRINLRMGSRKLDLRIATMPTIHGEAVAVRLLDNVRRALDLSKLGFSPENKRLIETHLGAPYGLFIVTGPTGSGKTTTLASALALLNRTKRKILTIEDPIEYELEGVNQTQVKPEIGLTFANTLRSFLRHDPDVIMVGEMRDNETAQIGVHAALTGHLVLTSLHTNTAAGAITRLLDMGIDAFLLNSCLRCVIGQRLVRVLCAHCRKSQRERLAFPEPAIANGGLDPDAKVTVWHAAGCARCGHTGYRERIAITEVLDVGEDIRSLVRPGVSSVEIEAAARAAGMKTMVCDGIQKCLQGVTAPEEVRRVAMEI